VEEKAAEAEINLLADTLVDSSQKETHEKVVARLNHLVTSGAAPLAFMSKMEPEALATLVNRHELEIFEVKQSSITPIKNAKEFEEFLKDSVETFQSVKDANSERDQTLHNSFSQEKPDKGKIQKELKKFQQVIASCKNSYQSLQAYADNPAHTVEGEQKKQLKTLKGQLAKMEGEFSKAFEQYASHQAKPVVDVQNLPKPESAVKKQPKSLYKRGEFQPHPNAAISTELDTNNETSKQENELQQMSKSQEITNSPPPPQEITNSLLQQWQEKKEEEKPTLEGGKDTGLQHDGLENQNGDSNTPANHL